MLHTLKTQILKTTLLFAGLAWAGAGALAQALDVNYDEVRLNGAAAGRTGGKVGAGLIAGHQYMGSDESRVSLLPFIDYQWANGFFAGVSNGLGYNFSNQPGVNYGLRVTADFGRKESRSSALHGLGDIEARPEIGAYLNLFVRGGFLLNSSVRYGSGNDRKGAVLDLGAAYLMELAPAWRLRLGVGTTLANDAYMQDHFGISAAQSASSGYAPYAASAGVRDVRALAGVTYALQPGMNLSGQLSISSLSGDAADSPIVRKKTSATGVLAFTYAF